MMAMAKTKNEVSNEAAMAVLLTDPAVRHAFDRETMLAEIAHAVIVMREAAGMTQAELAREAKTSQPQVARVESGKAKSMPGLELLTKLAAATGSRLRLEMVPSGTGPLASPRRRR